MRIYRLVLALCAVAVTLACSADDAGTSEDFSSGGDFRFEDAGTVDFGGASDASGTDVTAPVPEEPELEVPPALLPAASDRFVFVVNPSLNSVAKIDSLTLAVTPIPVGRDPRIVRASASGNAAVVLNRGSDSVSIIRASAAADTVDEVDILEACNALILAPSGTHAIAWYDNATARVEDRIGSLQEVALVDVEANEAFTLSVGFNIRDVVFDAAGARAYAITDDGINVIELGGVDGDAAIPTLSVSDADLFASADREIRVGGTGDYAIARSFDTSGVRIVDLNTGEAVTVPFEVTPTDVDVLADGRTALIALREQNTFATIAMPEAVAGAVDAVTIRADIGVPVGLVTLSSDESVALTFTTVGDDRRIGVVDLIGDALPRVLTLRKEIDGVLASPRPGVAVVVHAERVDNTGGVSAIEQQIAASEGLSILALDAAYAKLVLLPAEADELLFTPDGDHLFAMLADEATSVRALRWVDLRSFAARTVQLDGEPEAIGVVPATGRIFVAQASESGRITFLDPATGAVQHVTAFQLNAWID